MLRCRISQSPIVSYTVIVNPSKARSVCAVGADDLGEDDADGNILAFDEYIVESTGKIEKDGSFALPADAYRDKTTMEWIMANKDTVSETDALFSDYVFSRHQEISKNGGISGLKALEASSTGYASFGDEASVALQLEKDPNQADEILQALTDNFGKENLEKMKPAEFYRLYRDYAVAKQ